MFFCLYVKQTKCPVGKMSSQQIIKLAKDKVDKCQVDKMTRHHHTYKTTDPRSDDDHLLLASRIRQFGQSGFQGFQQQIFPVFWVETRHARCRTRVPRRHVTYILVLQLYFQKAISIFSYCSGGHFHLRLIYTGKNALQNCPKAVTAATCCGNLM